MPERLGLLGGTFDPPHLGHLHLALSAIEHLNLDRVVLIPAGRQPLKALVDSASIEHRIAMVHLLAGRDPQLAVDPIETERDGLSFSIDTVRSYRAAHPAAELTFLMGEDTAATLPHWREPVELSRLSRLMVMTRGIGEGMGGPLPEGVQLERMSTRRIDISATEIRARVRAEQSLRGFVTDDIAAYFAANGLYRTT